MFLAPKERSFSYILLIKEKTLLLFSRRKIRRKSRGYAVLKMISRVWGGSSVGKELASQCEDLSSDPSPHITTFGLCSIQMCNPRTPMGNRNKSIILKWQPF